MDSAGIIDFIVKWLTEYASKANVNGFVIGVSGGIDSAVTSALAANTGLPTLCVEMPIHQPQNQVNRASQHIEKLMKTYPNVERIEVELTSVFDDFVKSMPQRKPTDLEMPLVNSRARLRMTALYYFAGLENKLVVGTGNKIEDFGVGFFTKYGDGGVDLSPIADLNKSEVYALGKELGIVDSIMKAPPTDGLWGDDRTDEDQLGATYPELEWAMQAVEDKIDTSTLNHRQAEVMNIYRRLNSINQHKMNPIPVCLIPNTLR